MLYRSIAVPFSRRRRLRCGAVLWGALVMVSGCERAASPTAPSIDAGIFGDAGLARCPPVPSEPVVGIPSGAEVRAAWASDHYLLAWIDPQAEGKWQTHALRLARLDRQGRALAPPHTVAGLSKVDAARLTLAYDPRGGRATLSTLTTSDPVATCQVHITDRNGRTVAITGPLNDYGHPVSQREAVGCWAAPVGEAIAGVWAQRMPGSSETPQLYLQWYGAYNMPLGQRHALGTLGVSELSRVRLQSIGVAVGIAFPQGGSTRTVLAAPGEVPRDVTSAPSITLARAGEQLLIASADALQVVDGLGAVRAKLSPPGGALLGALRAADRWLVVVREGARVRIDSYDESWVLRGQERVSATSDSVLLAGNGAAALWRPSQPERIEPLLCTEPSVCTAFDETVSAPTAPPCTSGACQLVLRLGYLSGRVLGYRRVDAPLAPVDLAQAKLIATQHIADKMDGSANPQRVDQVVANEEVAIFMRSPSDLGGFCAVSLLTGQVLAAGGIVWNGGGDWWTPSHWSMDARCLAEPNAAIAAMQPSGTVHFCGPSGGIDGDGLEDTLVPTSAAQAWATAAQSDAATALADAASSGLIYLYTPSVASCRPETAEVLVFVSRRAP